MLGVLDLFSAAAGGWTLGLERAGFRTVAACESVEWRRVLYAENNPGVPIYDDVCTLSADRLVADLGDVPDVVVGSPPCHKFSAANVKGRGAFDLTLFLEAVRIIGECRERGGARWVALENSSYVRTRGYDRVAARLEALGYTCWPAVVGADDIGANHERKRAWIIAFHAESLGREGWRARGRWAEGHGSAPDQAGPGGDPDGVAGKPVGQGVGSDPRGQVTPTERTGRGRGLRLAAVDGAAMVQAAESLGADLPRAWADWNGGLGAHLRDDDGLSAALAERRFLVGDGSRETASAAGLIVEALGDSVVPQIPEAIGRAILRTEAALACLYQVRGHEAA